MVYTFLRLDSYHEISKGALLTIRVIVADPEVYKVDEL